jgi:hypothetical protein
VGWKQYLRQAEAAARRRRREEAREAARYYRALAKEQQRLQKEADRQAAADEVEAFENYLEMLVSVHTDCGRDWDWRREVTSPPPTAPVHLEEHEQAARAALASYAPGFFEKLFGGAKKRRAELERRVEAGRSEDQRLFAAATSQYQQAHAYWAKCIQLAPGVMALEPRSCRSALQHANAFDDLEAFGATINLESIVDGTASVRCTITKSDVIPEEELKLTSGGKVSTKEMASGKYWTLYQDHICSCAIRIAREAFAVLPVQRVIVNVHVVRLNSATGHNEPQTVLGVHFIRDKLRSLRLDAIDPSDSMANFPHRIKFKKASGMETVQPITHDEQWVTT